MSSAARLILTNSSLSSLPLFTMDMFLLADGVHAKLDTLRSRFFWEGAKTKRKYHLVMWAAVCRPKKFGGLGILNSKLMNVALLTKWLWRLAQNESGLWADLLRAKYFPDGNLFTAKVKGSPFWNGIQAVKPAFTVGARFQVHNGKSTRFWLDSWLGPNPLWMSHGVLFQLATDTELMVADALRTSPPVFSFMRNLTPVEGRCWNDLVHTIGARALSDGADAISWSLTASGKFSVKSLYSKITEGVSLDIARRLWKAGIPLKTKIFLWQMFLNRLPTSDNVAKRNGPSNGACTVCGSLEDANHVFFR